MTLFIGRSFRLAFSTTDSNAIAVSAQKFSPAQPVQCPYVLDDGWRPIHRDEQQTRLGAAKGNERRHVRFTVNARQPAVRIAHMDVGGEVAG
jgi:hypothetical protein